MEKLFEPELIHLHENNIKNHPKSSQNSMNTFKNEMFAGGFFFEFK